MAPGRPGGDADPRRALIALLRLRATAARSIRFPREWVTPTSPAETRPRIAPSVALAAILSLAAVLRGWNLGGGGVVIPYYLAGVRSQLVGWHNFFFNAFDPAGFVSLDKPPIAFWLQTASAKLLGFGAASVLLPQVLEGVAAVALLYWLVRRRFGVAAGLLAALVLALSPVSVAVDRSNNTESCLVLVLLLAAWALIRAIEDRPARHPVARRAGRGSRVQRQDAGRLRRRSGVRADPHVRCAAAVAAAAGPPDRGRRGAGRDLAVVERSLRSDTAGEPAICRQHRGQFDAGAGRRPQFRPALCPPRRRPAGEFSGVPAACRRHDPRP